LHFVTVCYCKKQISSKEDSFTNLLAGAFNERKHQSFRNKFCRALSNDDFIIESSDDCEIYTRYAFNIEKGDDTGNRGKVLPDMLMISPSQKSVIIIENKIFSREGYKQTVAYSSSVFMNELSKFLSEKHDIQDDYKIEYYFMTLLGETASSELFKPLKWTDLIIETIDSNDLIRPYDVLLADLNLRAMELKTFVEAPLTLSKSFEYYYGHRRRWINSKVVISKYFNPLLEEIETKYNRKVEYYISKADGRSEQLLILFSAPEWKSNNLNEYKNGDSITQFERTRNIHIEFSWQVGTNNASVLLHYETNPYYPDEKLKKLYPEIEPGYKVHREIFKNNMQGAIESSKYWSKANTKLALAKATCKGFMNLSYGDFKEWFSNAFDDAYGMVNDALKA